MLGVALAVALGLTAASDRDLSYDLGSPPPVAAHNLLDVYSPGGARRGSRPVVVWVHGGGWQQGDKRDGIRRKARLLTRAGYVLASVNHRLSGVAPPSGPFDPGRVRFPDHPRDVAEAVAWLHRRVARFGGDPRRMVLMGHSSGAHVAALVATDPRYLRRHGVPRRVIRGVVSLDTAALDVRPLADPGSSEGARGIWSVFGTPAENAVTGAWAAASPLLQADRGDPPFLQLLGATASAGKRRQSREMARALGQSTRSVLRLSLDHVAIERLLGVNRRETRAVLSFLARATRRARDRSPAPGGSSAARR
ncbi:MAG: alpha/beta hydrolase [Thermoleophilaceae bacterium]|nr:alpha/beta hydrolase [Thermoleophilaceae bacterium]